MTCVNVREVGTDQWVTILVICIPRPTLIMLLAVKYLLISQKQPKIYEISPTNSFVDTPYSIQSLNCYAENQYMAL